MQNFVLRHFLILIITMVFTIPQNDLIELSLRLLYVTIYVLGVERARKYAARADPTQNAL